MIVFDNVSKAFGSGPGSATVLTNASFTLPTDKRLAILGAHGSGKSTLARLICGIELPDSGTIERSGTISYPLGFAGSFSPRLTGRQNILFAARFYGVDSGVLASFVADIAELGPMIDEPLGSFPPQLRTRFLYAMTYALPFDCYLIDGLPALGTPTFAERCIGLLNARAAEGGFIMTARDPRIAKRWCDHGAVLHRGQVTLFPTLDDAIEAFKAVS